MDNRQWLPREGVSHGTRKIQCLTFLNSTTSTTLHTMLTRMAAQAMTTFTPSARSKVHPSILPITHNLTRVYSPIGKFLPTRRTPGISTSDLLARLVSGYRHRVFDKKLAKMGMHQLMAEGSDWDESASASERESQTLRLGVIRAPLCARTYT